MAKMEFWYEFGSTYSYPAAMRIERLAAEAGVEVRWRPFLLGPIFKALGFADSPFNVFAAKGRYMWRDLTRICEAENIPLTLPPAKFPQNPVKAARVALLGEQDGWLPAFSRGVFLANFAEQKDIFEDATLASILADLGLDPEGLLAEAATSAAKEALRKQTEEAIALDLFGAPTFLVGKELFWGNDRLEQALAFARR